MLAQQTSDCSSLSGLRFSSASRPRVIGTGRRTRRQIVLEFLDQQIGVAEAALAGKEFTIAKHRYRRGEDGAPVRTEVEVRPRRSFWRDGNVWLVEVRYGNALIELSPGCPTVVAGADLEAVIRTFRVIRSAVAEGEADAAIDEAAERAKRGHARR